jgi:hypothetical protein
MTPTPKLRFVERVIAVPATDGEGRTVRVLQQLWIPDNDTYEEWLKTKDGVWRDVPVEKEQ